MSNSNRRRANGMGLLLLFVLLAGCIDDRFEACQTGADEVVMQLSLDVPGSPLSTTRNSVRAMNAEDEVEMDMDNLQVLVFEETASGEQFRYKASIMGITSDGIVMQAKVSRANEKYRFVVLANASGQEIVVDTPKAEALNSFTFDCVGTWNAGGSNARAIPMWGESPYPVEVKKNARVAITMHRALARVDVGLNFEFDDKRHPTGEVKGLDNFKIKSIRVYRTKNKGYVASSAANINADGEIVSPHIPLDAMYNLPDGTSTTDRKEADKKPLLYELTNASDKFIREIYIPESFDATGNPSMDDVPCLVIGGYYGEGNTATETFYRIDFADYDGTTPPVYKSILRNHRYLFNIKKVTNAGFPDEEKALHSLPVNMELSVHAWRYKTIDYQVEGSYFFALDTREVWFEAIVSEDNPSESGSLYFFIPFRTNIEIKTTEEHRPDMPSYENVSCTWESSGGESSDAGFVGGFFLEGFEVPGGITVPYNTIAIECREDNTEAEIRCDKMIIEIENFKFDIKVFQKAEKADALYK